MIRKDEDVTKNEMHACRYLKLKSEIIYNIGECWTNFEEFIKKGDLIYYLIFLKLS